MLAPDNRLLLPELLRPPPEYEFDAAMAVTYTLDLEAMLSVPLALVGGLALAPRDEPPAAATEMRSSEIAERRREPVALLAAVKAHASNITVFAQAGQIAVPGARRAFTFLEDCVVPVVAPSGGVVHAKVWVLRFRLVNEAAADLEPSPRVRVIVGSRNLTFDPSWDTVASFDALPSTASGAGATSLAGIADLFDALAAQPQARRASAHHRERVATLSADVRGRRFAMPRDVDSVEAHVLGISGAEGGRPQSPLPAESQRALVISPFVSASYFGTVQRPQAATLVSREAELDRLDTVALKKAGHLDEVYAFGDDSLGAASEIDTDSDRYDSYSSPDFPGRPLAGLHAKIFAFDCETHRSRLFIGSANATGAAFTRNVEVLLELEGPTDRVGIESLIGSPDASDADGVTLRRLLAPYNAVEPDVAQEDPIADALDAARRHLGATLSVSASVAEDGGLWSTRYLTNESVTLPDDRVAVEGWRVSCSPLGPAIGQDVDVGDPLDVSFTSTLEDVSAWLVIRVIAHDGQWTSTLLPARVADVPDGFATARDTAVMRGLIGNGERFLWYLVALLSGHADTGDGERAELSRRLDVESTPQAGGIASVPTLEVLLRTLRTHPERLRSLEPLVDSFLGDPAADDALMLSGFGDVWRTVSEVGKAAAPGRTGRRS